MKESFGRRRRRLFHHHHHPSTNFSTPFPFPFPFPFEEEEEEEVSGGGFEFGELEEAIVLQPNNKKPSSSSSSSSSSLFRATGAGAATSLEMFPSLNKYHHQPPFFLLGSCHSKSGEEETSTDSGSALNNNTVVDHHLHFQPPESSPITLTKKPASVFHQQNHLLQQIMATDHHHNNSSTITRGGGGGPSHHHPSPKPTQEKTLRRLAQNREAARKSRLRKKAYVQQLETSRIKLSQLEQDLQRARSQGFFMGGGASTSISSGAAIFDMEYARWLDDDHRHMSELRTGLQAHLSDGDLRVTVDVYISHYDELFQLKAAAAKSDVFHLITGMWTTPAERCFLWMAGFRPSDLIKMLITQLDPLTEQQVMGIYSLQHSSQQAEEALSQGLEQLQQSMVDTIAGVAVTDGMQQMAMALGKLTNLEGFIRQADNLRQQTLHQLRRILTVRQAARCFLVIGEYYARLRALSSLWASRPRDQTTVISDDNSCQTTMDLHMVQAAASQNHFSSF